MSLTDDQLNMFPVAKCQHPRLKFTLTPNLIHHGRVDCEICGSFVRWLPKPETVERRVENARRLERLRARWDSLSDWQKQFVFSIEKSGHLSPKQQIVLERIDHEHAHNPAQDGSKAV